MSVESFSTIGTDSTASWVPGPGRTLGYGLHWAGRHVETWIERIQQTQMQQAQQHAHNNSAVNASKSPDYEPRVFARKKMRFDTNHSNVQPRHFISNSDIPTRGSMMVSSTSEERCSVLPAPESPVQFNRGYREPRPKTHRTRRKPGKGRVDSIGWEVVEDRQTQHLLLQYLG